MSSAIIMDIWLLSGKKIRQAKQKARSAVNSSSEVEMQGVQTAEPRLTGAADISSHSRLPFQATYHPAG